MRKKKVLFIANHRLGRSPGQRFRFEQYLDFLEYNGFECTLSNIISEEDDRILYQKGKYLKKAAIELKSHKIRRQDVARSNDFDLIFIFREALLTKSVRFEKAFTASNAKVIFDFDDAIWLPNVSTGNKNLSRLKSTDKIRQVLPLVDLVFAGNEYLASFAKQYNNSVKVIPTTIDTDYHKPAAPKASTEAICIGWTGTDTTRRYLNSIKNALKSLKEQYKDKIQFKIICDRPWEEPDFEVENERWSKEHEIEQLQAIDIGLMPLSDDEWSRGKCGFKALQYMAVGAVPVVSPVGVNQEIVKDGKNGFFANSDQEWINKIGQLIESVDLRKRLGETARESVLKYYSVEAQKHNYLNYFEELLNHKN